MTSQRKAIAIVGSYRKQGVVDSAVDEILLEVEKHGVEVKKIYLLDQHIEFCTNCRTCMQSTGLKRGKCVIDDDMEHLLTEVESADCLVLAAPTNVGNVTALTRKFMERCAGFGYWPWGSLMPKIRNKGTSKKVVLVSASAAPAWAGRCFSGTLGGLKKLAWFLGAKPVGTLWVGLVNEEHMQLSAKSKRKAQALGRKLLTLA